MIMRVLTFTTLFPNSEQPNNAIFIQHRMAAVHKYCDAEVRVVAPIPWFPKLPVGSERWRCFARIPSREVRAGMEVYHPRYLVTPKVGMTLYGLFMFLGVLATVRRIYREWPFDIIDAHYVYPDGVAAILLGRLFKCPVVVSARGTDINLYPCFRSIRPMIKRVVVRAEGLISVCRSLADIMIELGADASKVRVIPNGIDPELFFVMDQEKARAKLGIRKNGRVLLTVGALIERKGMHLLIEALQVLRNRNGLSWSTFIVGKGKERQNLETQILAAGLQDKVILSGEVNNSELIYWYNAADLFFLGSSNEGWPNVVSEAIACGTPVVATKVDGIPDILHSPELGIIVDHRDVSVFAAAIQEGFSRKWNREQISVLGRRRTWKTVAREVYAMFSEITD